MAEENTTKEINDVSKSELSDLLCWHEANEIPAERGWYECLAVDDRWNGEMRYRAWGNDNWWIPLTDGWLSSPVGLYKWRGPVADVMGPAPDGTNPQAENFPSIYRTKGGRMKAEEIAKALWEKYSFKAGHDDPVVCDEDFFTAIKEAIEMHESEQA